MALTRACLAVAALTLSAGLANAQAVGADVVLSDVTNTTNYGAVSGIRGYAIGSNTCNIGTANLGWINGGSPGLGMNGFRLAGGRITQIGQSFAKTACCAAAGSGCGSCNGAGGNLLGSGCLDVYSSGWNGGQSRLGPRSVINGNNGQVGSYSGVTGDAIFRRLQIRQTDLATPGAIYFIEGVYVATDDATTPGAPYNNASYKRVTVNANYDLTVTGAISVGKPAIYAWKEHGLGVNVPDPNVTITNIDVNEGGINPGRFIYGYKVSAVDAHTWHYEIAIYNLNSDKSGGSLSIPVPRGVQITNVGFSDVASHSGEPFDNSDWGASVFNNTLTWKSPQTYTQNANSNALRWGTMYNFYFDANVPPVAGNATFGLFKPNTPQTLDMPMLIPSTPPCVPDMNLDGNADQGDVDYLINVVAGGNNPMGADPDFNKDGNVDQGDVDSLINVIAGAACP